MLGRVMRRSARLAAAFRPFATMSMTADADRLLSVQNYYGEVLKSSKDLKVLPAGISIRDPFFVAGRPCPEPVVPAGGHHTVEPGRSVIRARQDAAGVTVTAPPPWPPLGQSGPRST